MWGNQIVFILGGIFVVKDLSIVLMDKRFNHSSQEN